MRLSAPAAQGRHRPVFGTYRGPPFKFRIRYERMDWKRIRALDVDRVIQEVDLATLQDYITSITLGKLDHMGLSQWKGLLDPGLLKALRLAQLMIEYLLHCQDCLTTSGAQLQAQLWASLDQQERVQEELKRLAEELKVAWEQRHWDEKTITNLEELIHKMSVQSYYVCHHCDMSFPNTTFLRTHIQRRHEDPTKKRKEQEKSIEEAVEKLRSELNSTKEELKALMEKQWQPQDDFKEQHQQALKGLQALKEKIEIQSQTVCHRKEEELEDSLDEREKVLEAPKGKRNLLKRIKRPLHRTIPDRRESKGVKKDARVMPTMTLSYHEKVQPVRREEKSPHFLSPREKLVRKAPGGEEAEQNKASVAQPERKVSVKCRESLLVTKEVQSKTSTQHKALPSNLGEPPVLIPHYYGINDPGRAQVPTLRVTTRAQGNFRTPDSQEPLISSERNLKRDSGQRAAPKPPRAPARLRPQSEDNWDLSDKDPLEGSSQAPYDGSRTRPYTVRRVLVMSRQEWEQAKKVAEGASVPLPDAAPPQAATTEGKPQLSDESDVEEIILQDVPRDEGSGKTSQRPEKDDVSNRTPGKHKICNW